MDAIDWKAARALWGFGYDTQEIAEAFGVDESDIYNNLARLYGAFAMRAA